MSDPKPNVSREELVKYLRIAAQLEHTLALSYQYAAFTIKAVLSEFDNDQPLRALYFEKFRRWKRQFLMTSRDEMRHLHYVQCMLRALHEPPEFSLPPLEYNESTNSWGFFVESWIPKDKDKSLKIYIPLLPVSEDVIKQFVLFESTDALQDVSVFGPENMSTYQALAEFEDNFDVEMMTYGFELENKKDEIDQNIQDYIKDLVELKTVPLELFALPTEEVKPFQSIKMLYDWIEAGFEKITEESRQNDKAFRKHDLDPEQNDSSSLGFRGLIGIKPLYTKVDGEDVVTIQAPDSPRTRKLTPPTKSTLKSEISSTTTPNLKAGNGVNIFDSTNSQASIKLIIDQITGEGEGFMEFIDRSTKMLEKFKEEGYYKKYIKAVHDGYNAGSKNNYMITDKEVRGFEQLRNSHLYKFIIAYQQYKTLLVSTSGDLSPSRDCLDLSNNFIKKMASEIPLRFNQCYLVVVYWLSNIYKTPKPVLQPSGRDTRRLAIEQLATFPLMTLSIRPFLEMWAFFTDHQYNDKSKANPIFNLVPENLPNDDATTKLFDEWKNANSVHKSAHSFEFDNYCLNILTQVSNWAKQISEEMNKQDKSLFGNAFDIIQNKLASLKRLYEFENQFSYRKKDGMIEPYSEALIEKKEDNMYEEETSSAKFSGFGLKVNFGGRSLVLMPTDPDPSADESGSSGGVMLHHSDCLDKNGKVTNKTLDRRIMFQETNSPERAVLRDYVGESNGLGVKVKNISLGITVDGKDDAAVANDPHSLCKFIEIHNVDIATEISVDLLSSGDQFPYFVGDNNLVSGPPEIIDPFIIQIFKPNQEGREVLLQREVFNQGKSLIDMTPVQRGFTHRNHYTFDLAPKPSWAKKLDKSINYRNDGLDQQPFVFNTANKIYKTMRDYYTSHEMDPIGQNQIEIDKMMGYAMRIYDVMTNVNGRIYAYYRIACVYDHSISGEMKVSTSTSWLNELTAATQGCVTISPKLEDTQRDEDNARWVIEYNLEQMSTDTLSFLVLGSLYIPANFNLLSEKKEDRVFDSIWRINTDMYERNNQTKFSDWYEKLDHALIGEVIKYDEKEKKRDVKIYGKVFQQKNLDIVINKTTTTTIILVKYDMEYEGFNVNVTETYNDNDGTIRYKLTLKNSVTEDQLKKFLNFIALAKYHLFREKGWFSQERLISQKYVDPKHY